MAMLLTPVSSANYLSNSSLKVCHQRVYGSFVLHVLTFQKMPLGNESIELDF